MSRLIRFLFSWTTPFWLWIAPSVYGKDGLTSGRKISSFVFMLMILSTTSKILMKDNPTMIHVYLLCVLVGTFLLLQGILTVQNIVDILKNGNADKKVSNDGQASIDQQK